MLTKCYIEGKDIKKIYRNFKNEQKPWEKYPRKEPHVTLQVTDEKAEELIDKGFSVDTYEDKEGNTIHSILAYASLESEYPPAIYEIAGKNKFLIDNVRDLVKLDTLPLDTVDIVVSHSDNYSTPYIFKAAFYIAYDEFDTKIENYIDKSEDMPFEE